MKYVRPIAACVPVLLAVMAAFPSVAGADLSS